MSMLSILQIAHDHPDWTPGGTEIVAHDLARALDARAGVQRRASWSPRPRCSGRRRRPGRLARARRGPRAADRGLRPLLDDAARRHAGGSRRSAACSTRLRPDVVHLHGLDRIGAEIVPAIRRLAPRCRIVLTLHDYQLICPNDGLLLTTAEGARCRGAQPDRCRRCFPEQGGGAPRAARAHLLALLGRVDVFLAPSAFLRDRFVDWGLEPSASALVPNAVAGDARPGRRRPARPRRDRFAFFGNDRAAQGRAGPARRRGAAAATRRGRAGRAARRARLGGGGASAPPSRRSSPRAAPLAQHLGPYDRADVVGLMRRGRLDRRALDLVGERAAGHPGGPRRRPAGDLLGHRRHGRAGRGRRRRAARAAGRRRRRWPRRCARATDPDLWDAPGAAAGAGEPRRLRRRASRPLPAPSRHGWPHDPCGRSAISAASAPARAAAARRLRHPAARRRARAPDLRLRRAAARRPVHLVQRRGPLALDRRNAGSRPARTRWYGVAVLDEPCRRPRPRSRGGGRRAAGGSPRRRASTWRRSRWRSSSRQAGASAREVFGFLVRHLLPECAGEFGGGAVAPRLRPRFIAAAAERDGFIEIVAAPETGGFFAQGWSMSLQPGSDGPRRRRGGPGAARGRGGASSSATTSCRRARGFCLFGKSWNEHGPAIPGRSSSRATAGCCGSTWCAAAFSTSRPTARASTWGRCCRGCRAPDATLQAFRRVCRPRFAGRRHAVAVPCPIAAAFDAVLQAPDGTLLVTGWLLDPLQRVERVLIKSSGNLYAQLDAGWCPLPRADLVGGFAQDPRFAGLSTSATRCTASSSTRRRPAARPTRPRSISSWCSTTGAACSGRSR